MPRIEWDKTGERLYETGIKNGVLYPWMEKETPESGDPIPAGYRHGYAWNGLTALTESPSGAEETALYADDIKYISLRSTEEFGGTIEAYTYPDEFAACDGSAEIATGVMIGQQARKRFGLAYKTVNGNDTDGNEHGYKIHLIYNATASPSEKAYSTINDSPDAITFSWEFSTVPENVEGFKPTANIIIDSTKFVTDQQKAKLKELDEILFGRDADSTKEPAITDLVPRLPMPDEVIEILTEEN